MTREESLRTKTWVCQDGRHLQLHEITDDHLKNIVRFVERNLTDAEGEVNHIVDLQEYKEDARWLIDAEKDVQYWSSWLKLAKGEQRRRREEKRDASTQG